MRSSSGWKVLVIAYTVSKSLLADSKEALRRAGLEHEVRYVARGETYAFAPAP